MHRSGGAFTFLAALVLSAALSLGAASAQETTLSINQARALGFALIDQGQPGPAAQIAQALIARDPGDTAGWLMLARANRVVGRFEAARDAARQANRTADTDDARYAASMEMAAANFALERPIFAQFWLRRAAQVAPTEALRRSAIRNFRQVEARSPWQITFQFGLVPSSNVNNGSREDTIVIAGLPFTLSGDAQALSGLEASVSASARYRFRGIGDKPAQFSFGAAVQRVRLSDAARDKAPDARNGDYSLDAIELGFGQVLSEQGADVFWRLDTLLGRNWYGREPLSTYARAGIVRQWRVGESSVMSATASVERQNRNDQSLRSAWIWRAEADRTWALSSGAQLRLSGGLRRNVSDSAEIDHRAVLASATYRPGERVFDVATLDFGVSYEYRDYDESPFSTDGRRDDRVRLFATFGFPDINYFGFAPTLTLEGQRTGSNVSLYESEDFGVRLGIRSIF